MADDPSQMSGAESVVTPHGDRAAEAPQALPSISVVVIGRNEGQRLVRCLESIRAAAYPEGKLEIIYVDSDSTDDSCRIAAERGAKVITIHPTRPCAAAGRNAGATAANHEFVHFFDGDTVIHRDWFAKAANAMGDPRVACVFGRREEVAPRSTIYNFWTHHDWFVGPGEAESCAGDAMFRREVLRQAGGFDETLIAGEEPDLCFRIRSGQHKVILCLDEPMTLHDMNMTRFRQYWKRCTRTGHAYAEVGGRHPQLHSWRRARWRGPIHVTVALLAVILSIFLWTPLPFVFWMILVAALIMRNAWRMRGRLGSLSDAVLYSLHHYVAKLPITIGSIDFWLRSTLKRSPKALIEYR